MLLVASEIVQFMETGGNNKFVWTCPDDNQLGQ